MIYALSACHFGLSVLNSLRRIPYKSGCSGLGGGGPNSNGPCGGSSDGQRSGWSRRQRHGRRGAAQCLDLDAAGRLPAGLTLAVDFSLHPVAGPTTRQRLNRSILPQVWRLH